MSFRSQRFALVACLVAALSFAVAACGSSSNNNKSSGSGSSSAVPKGKKGGTVTALASGDVDDLDPGQTYYTFGYQVAYSVQRALYYYNPATGQKQIPDIAAGAPQISADHKSIPLKLQTGLKFSPPVHRAVTPSAIHYAFQP